MLTTKETSAQHKQAAIDHNEASKCHLLAAQCIEKNNLADAQVMSQSALKSCNVAQKSSAWACKDVVI